jgi:hypothetical protein
MRQFQPHGVSITLYRTQITPCRRKQTSKGVRLTLSCSMTTTIMVPTAERARANALDGLWSHHICLLEMDHLSRSVLSFRRHIAICTCRPQGARLCSSTTHLSMIAGVDPAYAVGQCEHYCAVLPRLSARCSVMRTNPLIDVHILSYRSGWYVVWFSASYRLSIPNPFAHHDRSCFRPRSSHQQRLLQGTSSQATCHEASYHRKEAMARDSSSRVGKPL